LERRIHFPIIRETLFDPIGSGGPGPAQEIVFGGVRDWGEVWKARGGEEGSAGWSCQEGQIVRLVES
jgi:hypothetical protein